MHYFCGSAKEVTGEFHAPRDGLTVRADHSIFLRYALDELGPEGSEAAERLGFPQEIFKTRIHEISGPKTISILSLLADAMVPLYRHRSQEIYLPFWNLPIPQGYRGCRYTEIPSSALDQKWQGHWIADALDYLRDNFIYYGISSEPLFKSNLERILSSTEHQEKCFILLGNDVRRADEGVKPGSYKAVADINRWTQEVSGNFSNVELISIRDFIETVSEIHSQSHFDRMIYFRLYKNIMKYFSKSDQGLAA
jgi:hypothetical protein